MRKVNLVVSAMVAVYLLTTPLAVGQGGNPPASTKEGGASSKVWVGRYAEYEEFLRTAVVDRTTMLGTTQRIFFKPGGLAASAALKAHASKLEIAGYKLDRVLGLDMVPPTVQARYKGEMTGLQLWVLDCRELKEVNEQNLRAPDPVKWAYQLNRLHTFEDLLANLDKKEGSPLVDPQWNLIVLDHSLAFTNTLAQPYEIGKKLNQIDQLFFDRIKALDKPTVQRAIGDLVDADSSKIRSLVVVKIGSPRGFRCQLGLADLIIRQVL